MVASYRKIDYSLRPAKHTERRMLIEIFRRLAAFEALDRYAYSGMGSVWFSDFLLVHKMLGIHDMTSMEWPRGPIERINDNVPLGAIKVIHKQTSQAIPQLRWDKRQIVWLDYDGLITPDVLLDVQAVTMRVKSGSILAVSVQCNQADEVDQAGDRPGAAAVSLFKDKFGVAAVGEIDEDDLYGWEFASTSRRLILQSIQDMLATTNSSKKDEDQIFYRSICEIEYNDDAKMTTIVVAFYNQSESEILDRCGFESLDFMSLSDAVIRIEMPNLTIHEMRHLQRQLPKSSFHDLDVRHMPRKEAIKYAKLYRYLPNFAVLEG